jgi:hypothetical protein
VRLKRDHDNVRLPDISIQAGSTCSGRIHNRHRSIEGAYPVPLTFAFFGPYLGGLIRVRVHQIHLFPLRKEPFRHQYRQRGFADPTLVAGKYDERALIHKVPFC